MKKLGLVSIPIGCYRPTSLSKVALRKVQGHRVSIPIGCYRPTSLTVFAAKEPTGPIVSIPIGCYRPTSRFSLERRKWVERRFNPHRVLSTYLTPRLLKMSRQASRVSIPIGCYRPTSRGVIRMFEKSFCKVSIPIGCYRPTSLCSRRFACRLNFSFQSPSGAIDLPHRNQPRLDKAFHVSIPIGCYRPTSLWVSDPTSVRGPTVSIPIGCYRPTSLNFAF